MSVVLDMLRTWRAPREVQVRRMAGPPNEGRALAVLLAGCGLIYVAQWPRLAREAHLDPSIALDARMAGALFAWLMVMPLALYALALVLRLVLSVVGIPTTGFRVRHALFWALLASVPAWLLSGLVAGFVGEGAALIIVSTVAVASVGMFTAAGLSVAGARVEAA